MSQTELPSAADEYRVDDELVDNLIQQLNQMNELDVKEHIVSPSQTTTQTSISFDSKNKEMDKKVENKDRIDASETEINAYINTKTNKEKDLKNEGLFTEKTSAVSYPWLLSFTTETIETQKQNNESEANKQVMKENSSENKRTQNNYNLFQTLSPIEGIKPIKTTNSLGNSTEIIEETTPLMPVIRPLSHIIQPVPGSIQNKPSLDFNQNLKNMKEKDDIKPDLYRNERKGSDNRTDNMFNIPLLSLFGRTEPNKSMNFVEIPNFRKIGETIAKKTSLLSNTEVPLIIQTENTFIRKEIKPQEIVHPSHDKDKDQKDSYNNKTVLMLDQILYKPTENAISLRKFAFILTKFVTIFLFKALYMSTIASNKAPRTIPVEYEDDEEEFEVTKRQTTASPRANVGINNIDPSLVNKQQMKNESNQNIKIMDKINENKLASFTENKQADQDNLSKYQKFNQAQIKTEYPFTDKTDNKNLKEGDSEKSSTVPIEIFTKIPSFMVDFKNKFENSAKESWNKLNQQVTDQKPLINEQNIFVEKQITTEMSIKTSMSRLIEQNSMISHSTLIETKQPTTPIPEMPDDAMRAPDVPSSNNQMAKEERTEGNRRIESEDTEKNSKKNKILNSILAQLNNHFETNPETKIERNNSSKRRITKLRVYDFEIHDFDD